MYVIQMWDESRDRYIDLHIEPSTDSPERFVRASRSHPASLFAEGRHALEACHLLEDRQQVFLTVLDRSTGQRMFEDYQLGLAASAYM